MGPPGKMCPRCSSGTALIGITNCFLFGSGACSTAQNSCFVLSAWSKPVHGWRGHRGPRGNPSTTVLLNGPIVRCAVKCHLLQVTRPLHSPAHSSCSYLQERKSFIPGVDGAGSRKAPPPAKVPLHGCCRKFSLHGGWPRVGCPCFCRQC